MQNRKKQRHVRENIAARDVSPAHHGPRSRFTLWTNSMYLMYYAVDHYGA